LLLNSDVLPDRAGWLAEMVDFIDRSPNIGAVAPKLLFEDDSIQHAGLYFERPDGEGLWSNEHYFKGLHRSLPAACTTRAVPAVTAACMLIAALVYREVGGLLGQYVQGDFEDSDLCMRLRAGGRQVWYLADVELFHLEGQSYPTPARVANGQFNRWLHTHLWNDAITALMSDPSVEPGSPDNRQLMEART
jgi:GT2 family glycosyltransferase